MKKNNFYPVTVFVMVYLLLVMFCDGSIAGNIETETGGNSKISAFTQEDSALKTSDMFVIAREDTTNKKVILQRLMDAAHSRKIVIAANNAPDNVKAGATFTCEDDSNEVTIQDAVDILARVS